MYGIRNLLIFMYSPQSNDFLDKISSFGGSTILGLLIFSLGAVFIILQENYQNLDLLFFSTI